MSGANTKVSRGGAKKGKSSVSPPPFDVTKYLGEPLVENQADVSEFIQATTLDEQLGILKSLIELVKSCDYNIAVIKFIVIVFFHTEAKHPLKGFISRNINRNENTHEKFCEMLSEEILYFLEVLEGDNTDNTKEYSCLILKLLCCVENFPPGTHAVLTVAEHEYKFLLNNYQTFVESISDPELPLSTKTEVYSCIQLTLRLLHFIVQKTNNDQYNVTLSHMSGLKQCIAETMLHGNMPMDTKSVAAILLLSTLDREYKNQGWYIVLNGDTTNESELIDKLMLNDAAKVCIYSAILTTVPIETLERDVKGTSGLVLCLENVLEVSERCPSDSGIAVCVARAVQHASGCLSQLPRVPARAAAAAWRAASGAADHPQSAVRFLSTHTLANLVRVSLDTPDLHVWSVGDARSRAWWCCARAWVGAGLRARGAVPAPRDLLPALADQHVQAQVTLTLEAYIEKYILEGDPEDVYRDWIVPILQFITEEAPDSPVITILENLLCKAIKLDENLLKYIVQYMEGSCVVETNLKCVLMLMNVVRKCNAINKLGNERSQEDAWNGLISYDLLEQALLDEDDETRSLALCALAESRGWSRRALHVLRRALRHAAPQAPAARDTLVGLLDKFIKRFAEGYRALKRQNTPNVDTNKVEYYLEFVEALRQQCYDSLLPGVNYSRRYVTLQLLLWIEEMDLDGYHRVWKPEYADTLLLHLNDSYETNKALALQILRKCPKHVLLKSKFSSDLDLNIILQKAFFLKPTESVSAAYQLEALITILPERICSTKESSSARRAALRRLLELAEAQCGPWAARGACPRSAPLYPALHLAHALLAALLAHHSEASSPPWQQLLEEAVGMCWRALAAVRWVVAGAAPEGMLPHGRRAHSHAGGEMLVTDDGLVTSQMILVCAWRTVKEACACIAACSGAILRPQFGLSAAEQMIREVGALTHRGAFEQAARALAALMDRAWRESPAACMSWLRDVMSAAGAAPAHAAAPTRRGAGLPYIVQSIVCTEPAERMSSALWCALSAARSAVDAAGRTHALLCVRALVLKCAQADSAALEMALGSLDAETFPERNAATLLWSSAMSRMFGPDGARRLSAYEFFHRYPHLYHTTLERLRSGCSSQSEVPRPSVAALLLLLARLTPAPDGTLADLKMESLCEFVVRACDSRSAMLRRLAARALPATLRPNKYMFHICWALAQCPAAPHNRAHGLCLQVASLLRAAGPARAGGGVSAPGAALRASLQLYSRAPPCYLVLHQHAILTELLFDKHPDVIDNRTMDDIERCLSELIFAEEVPCVALGREMCLSACLCLLYAVLHERCRGADVVSLVRRSLRHSCYELVLTTFDYLLALLNNDDIDDENRFQKRHNKLTDLKIIETLRETDEYVNALTDILKNNKYLECRHKCLKLLSLERDTQRLILGDDSLDDGQVIDTFIEMIEHTDRAGPDVLMHVYLKCLTDFVSGKLEEGTLKEERALRALRVVCDCSSSRHNDHVRTAVLTFLENNIDKLMELETNISPEYQFEYKATILSTLAILLEDESVSIRCRTSRVCSRLLPAGGGGGVTRGNTGVPGGCAVAGVWGARLRALAQGGGVPLLVTLALLDFKAEVRLTSESDSECRVFDQSERHNVYLEESIWTNDCAQLIIDNFTRKDITLIDYVYSVICDEKYKSAIERLCNDNVKIFKEFIEHERCKNINFNRKIEVFLYKLKSVDLK